MKSFKHFLFGKVTLYADERNRDGVIRAVTDLSVRADVTNDSESGGALIDVSPRDAKKIASALDKTGIIVYINSVCGIRNIHARACRRLGLAVGAVLFFCLLALSTAFVFKVEINGSEMMPKDKIRAELAELGVCVGARLDSIDATETEGLFMQAHPEYSWVSLNFIGTTVCLELKERETPAADGAQKLPQLLVAAADGTVREITVQSGKSSVRVGDTVKKGDLLISGLISGNGLQYTDTPMLRFDGAKGSVKAEVRDSFTVAVPYTEEQTLRRVVEKIAVTVRVLGREFIFGAVPNQDDGRYTAGEEKSIAVMGMIELPITYREYFLTEETVRVTVRDALQSEKEAEKRAYLKLGEHLGDAALTELEINKQETESEYTVTVVYSCIREIAIGYKTDIGIDSSDGINERIKDG